MNNQVINHLFTYISDKLFYILETFTLHLTFVSFLVLGFTAYCSIKRRKKQHFKAIKNLNETIDKNLNEPMSLHPVINEMLCAGCGSCVTACPEGEILQLINHKAVLIQPTKCVGHGACEQSCPLGAIDLVFGTKTRGMEIPRVSPDFETNVSGLYISGELGGMGLVRNAVKQGRLAAEHAISKINKNGETDFDLFIVGSGPAGFSATLSSISKDAKYKCIDQNSFGGTVYNFPRQKIVTSHPLNFALDGEKKFKKNVILKEELLEYWNQLKIKYNVKISERETFENLEGSDGSFVIKTSKGSYTSKKVLLCLGLRGSPRKLGLENEDQEKVAYNLIDPEQYQKSQITIVGGGNSALEAAQYLAKEQYQNDVILLVRKDEKQGLSRANEANQNLVKELEKNGKIKIYYNSSVAKIEKDTIDIKKDKEIVANVSNNYLFVFAGALMPFKFLMDLGIEIDKKHGEIVNKKDKLRA